VEIVESVVPSQAKRSHKPFPHHMANEVTFSPRFGPTADNLQAWVFDK
jgi:hypothetical protein